MCSFSSGVISLALRIKRSHVFRAALFYALVCSPAPAQTTGILNSERFCFLLVETTINAKFEPGITSNYILKLKIAEKNAKSITQNVAFEQRVYRTQIRYSVGRALILSRDTNKCWTIAYFVTWYS